MDPEYELKLRSEEEEKVYRFESADGIKSKNSFRPEELLLADEVEVSKHDAVLVIQSGFGFLGVVFGDMAGSVTMYEASARASEFSASNAKSNEIDNFTVENRAEISEIGGDFDKVVYAPADYAPVDLVKKRLGQAAGKLKNGGKIFIAGRRKSGLRRYRDFLKRLGEEEKIGERSNVRAYCFSDFSGNEKIELEKNFTAELGDFETVFTAAEGLFSSGKLDEGTRVLLENIELENPDRILDVGCGYGAISVFLSQKYDANFFLSDDDARATKYSRKNLEKNGVEDFEIKTSDCLDGFQDREFDVIVSNPPTHQGKGVTDKIFMQSHEVLKKAGELWMVYNQNMKFEDEISKKFESTEIVAKEDNFNVVRAVK